LSSGSISTSASDDLPVIAFATPELWERWLAEQHAQSAGVWLKIAKKASGIASVHYAQALDVALCYGWIDGQKGRFDDEYFLQRFTPRKARSKWSQVNRAKAEALIASGAMHPAGRAQVDAAKADGRWEAAYPAQSAASVPEDLQRALDADGAAHAFFLTLSAVNRYAILYRLHHVVKPEARTQRIAAYIEMLAQGRTLHD
jgi:uncharacterized protein YdeI (YjbR/CyaY-like superfamily)